jgi:hypothetical protein
MEKEQEEQKDEGNDKLWANLYPLAVFVVVLSATLWLTIGLLLRDPVPLAIRLCMICVGILALLILPCPQLLNPSIGSTIVLPDFENTQPRGSIALQITGLSPYKKVIYWTDISSRGHVTTTTKGGVANLVIEGIPRARDHSKKITVNRLGIDESSLPHIVFYRIEKRKGVYSGVKFVQI